MPINSDDKAKYLTVYSLNIEVEQILIDPLSGETISVDTNYNDGVVNVDDEETVNMVLEALRSFNAQYVKDRNVELESFAVALATALTRAKQIKREEEGN